LFYLLDNKCLDGMNHVKDYFINLFVGVIKGYTIFEVKSRSYLVPGGGWRYGRLNLLVVE
jgi:hypothetical protein